MFHVRNAILLRIDNNVIEIRSGSGSHWVRGLRVPSPLFNISLPHMVSRRREIFGSRITQRFGS